MPVTASRGGGGGGGGRAAGETTATTTASATAKSHSGAHPPDVDDEEKGARRTEEGAEAEQEAAATTTKAARATAPEGDRAAAAAGKGRDGLARGGDDGDSDKCQTRTRSKSGRRRVTRATTSLLRSLASDLMDTLDPQLLSSPSFLLLAFSGFLTLAGFFIPFTYIVDRAVRQGASLPAFLLSFPLLSLLSPPLFSQAQCFFLQILPVLHSIS